MSEIVVTAENGTQAIIETATPAEIEVSGLLKGDKGDTGAPGAKGDTGPAGPQGVQGIEGPTGAQGPAGNDGVDGSKIYSGAGAPSTIHNDGDFYFDNSTGDYYEQTSGSWGSPVGNLMGPTGATGPQGPQGIQGPAGTDGTDGTNGAKWYEGAGAPSTVHNDGDFYLDTSNGDVYEQVSGSWGTAVGNIRGPAGSGTGDMLKSTYDPTSKNADAFSQDNMADGTTNKNYSATEKTKLSGIATGADVTATQLPVATHAATSKATPVDADEMPIADSAATFGLKKLTWANLKATLKTYFDGIYQAALGYTAANDTAVVHLSGAETLTGKKTFNAGNLLDKGEIVFDVKAYGAVGDDTTNDATAINSAITAAIAAGGGTVFFPAATYKTTASISIDPSTLTSPLRLSGFGAKIDYTGSSDAIQILTNIAVSDVQHAERTVYVEGLHIVGTGSATSAIRNKATMTTLRHLVIENFTNVTGNVAAIIMDTSFHFWVEQCHLDTIDIKNTGYGIMWLGEDESGGVAASAANNKYTNIHVWVNVASGKGFWGKGLGTSGIVQVSRSVFDTIVVHAQQNNVIAYDFSNCYMAGSVMVAPSVDVFGSPTGLTGWKYSYSDIFPLVGPTIFPTSGVATWISGGGGFSLHGGNLGTTFQVNYGGGITPRINTTASSATPAINTDTTDMFTITALAVAITSMSSGLTGTPLNGQRLLIRIKDNGTARAITWGASFGSSGIATLPTTTVVGKTHLIGFVYDSVAALWVCMAVDATGY